MNETGFPTVPYLTTRAHHAFALAHALAEQRGHDRVTVSHLGVAIIRQQGVPLSALYSLGVSIESLEQDFEDLLAPPSPTHPARAASAVRVWSPWDEAMIESAREEARVLGTEFYGTEHLLLALLRDDATAPAQVLAKHGVRYDLLRREIQRLYKAQPQPDEDNDARVPPNDGCY